MTSKVSARTSYAWVGSRVHFRSSEDVTLLEFTSPIEREYMRRRFIESKTSVIQISNVGFTSEVSDYLVVHMGPEQVILFSLRTGHNRLYTHTFSKFKVGESEMCPFNADIMSAEHLLQHCQLRDALSRDMWPEPIPRRDKLCGSLEELRRTSSFDRATGISV